MRIIREDAAAGPPPDLMERLAEIEHQRWTSQAFTALFEMDDARRRRWFEEMTTPYVALSERLKEMDREQVRRYWPEIEAWMKEKRG